MIRFEQVSKVYSGGHQALQKISFHLHKGEMAFLTGHSGAGKSTLLKLISVTDRHKALLRLAATRATSLAAGAVDAMYHAGGGAALYTRSPLQRHLRDVHTATQHLMVQRRNNFV